MKLHGIQARMILFFSTLLVMSGLLLSYFISKESNEMVIDSMGTRARIIAEKASNIVDSDDFQKIIYEVQKAPASDENQNKIMEMPEYKKLQENLHDMKELSGFKFLYTMIELPDKKYMYIVDGMAMEDENFSAPGELEGTEYPMLPVVFQTKKTITGELTHNEKWGVTITAYAPILDKNAKMIGVVGADFDASSIYIMMQKNKRDTIIVVTITLLITILLSSAFARHLSRPLQELIEYVDHIAEGNFTANFVSKDKGEIGKLAVAFNKMTNSLRTLIQQIVHSSQQLAVSAQQASATSEQSATVANQISASAMDFAQGAEQQLEAVNKTSLVVKQITTSIQNVAVNAVTAKTISERTVASANEGTEAVDKAIEQMDNIRKVVSHSAQVVSKLGERSKEIDQIVSVISGIASQTNLLALNAAIEAARAGEQGRGFAVVAEEVRKLAEQSQEAAKKIADLIKEIQTATVNAVNTMSDGTREVNVGIEVVSDTGARFRDILGLIDQVSDQVADISNSIQEVSNGSQQIVVSVQAIEQIGKESSERAQTVSAATEEQSASMQEIAALSQSLSSMADGLRKSCSKFKV